MRHSLIFSVVAARIIVILVVPKLEQALLCVRQTSCSRSRYNHAGGKTSAQPSARESDFLFIDVQKSEKIQPHRSWHPLRSEDKIFLRSIAISSLSNINPRVVLMIISLKRKLFQNRVPY